MKRSKRQTRLRRVRVEVRPVKPNKSSRTRPKKEKSGNSKDKSELEKRQKMVTPPPLPQPVTLSPSQICRRKRRPKMPPKWLAIAAIKRVTLPRIVPRQKTSYIFGKFHISDCRKKASTETPTALSRVLYICYLIQFQKGQAKVKTLINSSSEVNVITTIFIAKLRLRPRPTNISVQKIESSPLETYNMSLAVFPVRDSLEKVWFFKEILLLAVTSMEIVLGMSFLPLINTQFTELKKLTWTSYHIAKASSTTS